jgi:two-component system, NarL family, response regulator LiaR
MSIRALIVDDHEIVRCGLRAALKSCSEIEVVGEAVDGVTAISKSAECLPDVVLMDIRMPLMDGIAATREIKINYPNTRVLILTSNDNQQDVFAALAAGADGYCLKNTQSRELAMAIQAVHSGAGWLDAQIAQLVLRSITAPSSNGSSPPSKQPSLLSSREIEVLRLLVEGLSNSDIALRLVVSPETVKTHMKHIMEKLQVSDRTQAAVKAMRDQLV